jgi:hypothetical protein
MHGVVRGGGRQPDNIWTPQYKVMKKAPLQAPFLYGKAAEPESLTFPEAAHQAP